MYIHLQKHSKQPFSASKIQIISMFVAFSLEAYKYKRYARSKMVVVLLSAHVHIQS